MENFYKMINVLITVARIISKLRKRICVLSAQKIATNVLVLIQIAQNVQTQLFYLDQIAWMLVQ